MLIDTVMFSALLPCGTCLLAWIVFLRHRCRFFLMIAMAFSVPILNVAFQLMLSFSLPVIGIGVATGCQVVAREVSVRLDPILLFLAFALVVRRPQDLSSVRKRA